MNQRCSPLERYDSYEGTHTGLSVAVSMTFQPSFAPSTHVFPGSVLETVSRYLNEGFGGAVCLKVEV